MRDKIIINGFTIENLTPIKKSFINKNKKFSARGFIDKKKVKIYEVFDKKQGSLREFVSNHKELSAYFPNLIAYDEKFIVEEWLEGNTLMEINLNFFKKLKYSLALKKMIKLMWSINYDEEVFDYIDYIYKRVGKICHFDLNKIPMRINHNDLSLDNILITPNGLKIIDNEYLGNSRGWILNLKNSFLKGSLVNNKYITSEQLIELWKIRVEWSQIH
tara:strand:- start:354 stop:1004 length:651 start_codon:yes stop_codon:yes gene_type:complete